MVLVSLGHYPDYIDIAEQLDARVFSLPASEWKRLTDDERWAANRRFLDEQIAVGARFVLATRPGQARPGSYFELELKYLISVGYVARRGEAYWELVR